VPTLLAVIPHPDDESYSFAATMAAAALSGWDCRVVCASAGGAGKRYDGLPFHRPPLAEKRVQELGASCELLGAAPPECWGLVDGGLRTGVSHSARVAKAIVACAPQVVLTLGADGAYGHPDHLAVHEWVTTAWKEAEAYRRPALLFPVFAPGLFVPQWKRCRSMMGEPPNPPAESLGRDEAHYSLAIGRLAAVKRSAIAAHRSQLPRGRAEALFPAGLVDALMDTERFEDARGAPNSDVQGYFGNWQEAADAFVSVG